LDFASPLEGLGGKIGFDATRKIGSETSREWGKELRMSPHIVESVSERWDELFPQASGSVRK
ncbi:MAG: UbiD family decarboxylase, partial [Mesorhizobium sp.]